MNAPYPPNTVLYLNTHAAIHPFMDACIHSDVHMYVYPWIPSIRSNIHTYYTHASSIAIHAYIHNTYIHIYPYYRRVWKNWMLLTHLKPIRYYTLYPRTHPSMHGRMHSFIHTYIHGSDPSIHSFIDTYILYPCIHAYSHTYRYIYYSCMGIVCMCMYVYIQIHSMYVYIQIHSMYVYIHTIPMPRP